MSAILTWASSGNGVKTGVTINTMIDDLDTLVTSLSGNAAFSWQTAGKSSAATPFYYLMSRKSGSAGRLALICWTSAPAANNVAILDASPTTNIVYVAWFPNGTGTTLSNLTAASGTICGNDTAAVKVAAGPSVGSAYAASFVPFYMDSAEGVVFAWGNPASANIFSCGGGALLVDGADVAYDCTIGYASAAVNQFGSQSASIMAWLGTTVNAGANTAGIRTNYGSSNRVYFHGWVPSGPQFNQAVSGTDILTNTAVTQVAAVQTPLLGQTKVEGFVLKLRQIGYGPGSVGPFTVYNITGPTVNMRQLCNQTAGSNGNPWMTNFKI